MEKVKKEFAVITGAAGGLGKAFSFELAKRGYNVIMIDLSKKGLLGINSEIEKEYNVKSVIFEADLTNIEYIKNLTTEINEKYRVSVLINNVGTGGTKHFEDATIEYLNTIIQLNVMATTIITRLLTPNLRKQQQSYILNVSSMAAFSPMGFKTVYPASKVFIHSFTRGLYQEFKNTNIFVSVVNPGPMKTNPEIIARIEKQGVLGKIGLLSPEKVAEISIRQLFKRDTLIMLNYINGFNWLLMKILPINLRLPLLSKTVRRELDGK